MAVDQGLARQFRQGEMSCFMLEKFAQQKCLLRQPMGPFVIRKQVQQFVAKHGGTTRLQDDDWNVLFDLGFQRAKNLEQQILGAV